MKKNEDIIAMETFLKEQNMDIPNKLDKLGEQCTMAIFKSLRIRKNPETHKTTPDFTFYVNETDTETNTVNKKSFQMETTVLGDIYNHIFDIYTSKEHRKKIEGFLREYDVMLDPLNIHREDEEIFKYVFMDQIEELKDEKKITIEGKIRNYTITSQKLDEPKKYPIFAGKIKREKSNLENIISKKDKQLKKTDVISFFVLNKYIWDLDIQQAIYKEHSIGSLENNGEGITQYEIEKTIWEVSNYKLKYAIFCYPSTKEIYLCPSLKFYPDSALVFCGLTHCFKEFDFNVKVAKHGTEWI